MKRYLNKAIVYKELKGSWWIALLLMFLMGTSGYDGFCGLLRVNEYGGTSATTTTIESASRFFTDTKVFPLIIVALIIIAQTVMGADRKGDFERIAAMPFTRKETIISKLVVGELVLIIPVVINFIMILSMYLYNYDAVHTYIKIGILFKLFILNLLNYSAILIFLMLIQSICGKKIGGSVLGAIFMFVPIGLVMIISFFSAMHLEYFNIMVNIKEDVLDKVVSYLLVPLYNQFNMIGNGVSYFARIIILICLICIFTVLTYYSYKENQFERNGNVLVFSFLEPILKVGVSICCALTAFAFAYLLLRDFKYRWNIQEGATLFISDIVLVVVGVLAYFLTNKYIKANRD